jgi:hypothetical protein
VQLLEGMLKWDPRQRMPAAQVRGEQHL